MLTKTAQEYYELDFDVIPIPPGQKEIKTAGWQKTDPIRLWRRADEQSNYGIRGGGVANVAVIDCDDKTQSGTFDNVQNWLWGYGLEPGSYPVVQTASGIGRHIYISMAGVLPGDARNLDKEFGAGELRYGPGAYVVAPPSRVDSSNYSLISGDFRNLPSLQTADIVPLIGSMPDAKSNPTIPRKTMSLLRGYGLAVYQSRSEAEAAAVMGLINAGFDYSGIHSIFESFPVAGKYKEKQGKERIRWLGAVYHSALQKVLASESPKRQQAKRLLQWAQNSPWPGRTGSYDQVVYISHARVAYRAATLEYSASCRDLAESAGVGHRTVLNANKRLVEKGLLERVRAGGGEYANTYLLLDNGQLAKSDAVAVQPERDAFRWGALNKTGAAIYANLLQEPMTTKELAVKTGKHVETIRRSLRRMSKLVDPTTGELLPLIERNGLKWCLVSKDLLTTAKILGASGKGQAQFRRHAKERRDHNLSLEIIRQKKHNKSVPLPLPNL